MIRRRREAFRRRSDGFVLAIEADERHLVRRLIGEVRDLLTTTPPDDPKMTRLFPPAYLIDEDHDVEYQRLMRDELVASRLAAITTLDEFLADEKRSAMTAAEVESFAVSVNAVRLVLGTLLGVSDDDADEPNTPDFALYHFLSWLVDGAVSVLMTR